MDRLVANVQKLVEVEAEHPQLLDPQLLSYLKEWLALDNTGKQAEIPQLQKELTYGLDVDLTGTQWEEEWLANGKVCLCDGCIVARECMSDIEAM